jgi:uncharacterized membrane protein YukC
MKIAIILITSISIAFTQSLDEQIKSLESVTPKERVELMNKIKEQLIEMNQNERMNTIEKLRAKMNPSQKSEPAHENKEGMKELPEQIEGESKDKERHPKDFIKERVEQPNKEFERPKEHHERVREEGKRPLPPRETFRER